MSDPIQPRPRPWRVEDDGHDAYPDIVDATGDRIALDVLHGSADLIVRLVNAEPDVVAALEAAERAIGTAVAVFDENGSAGPAAEALNLLRAALAKLRG